MLVTGAGGALGTALCTLAVEHGWRVLAADRDPRALAELEEALGTSGAEAPGAFEIETADLTKDESVARLPALFASEERLCVAHLAGGFLFRQVHQTSDDEWREQMMLNLETTFRLVRCFARAYHEGRSGAFVAVGSVHALRAPAGVGAYAASKSGVVRLIESAAAEAPRAARFNAVLPHTMDTPANRAAMPEADPRNWVPPREVAEVILFLLSEGARAINGAALEVGRRI